MAEEDEPPTEGGDHDQVPREPEDEPREESENDESPWDASHFGDQYVEDTDVDDTDLEDTDVDEAGSGQPGHGGPGPDQDESETGDKDGVHIARGTYVMTFTAAVAIVAFLTLLIVVVTSSRHILGVGSAACATMASR